jgi:hypothetical protein
MVTGDEAGGRDEPERDDERQTRRERRRERREERTEERIERRRDPDDDGGGLAAWGPRILAPLAFFLAATILILLISSALAHDEKNATTLPSASNTPTEPLANQPGGTGTVTGKPGRKFYVIKEGDTLESIANKKNTTLDDLLRLNPGIDPTTLTPGQKIRIS